MVTPINSPVLSELRTALESACGPGVEHILVLNGKTNVSTMKKLKKLSKEFSARFFVLENSSSICEALNFGVSKSQSDFLVFLNQSDFFTKGYGAALKIVKENYDFVYSDYDETDSLDRSINTHLNPDWSPIRLTLDMYAGPLIGVRKSIFEKVGGLRSKQDGSTYHDLALRISRATNRVKHIPIRLYNRRSSNNDYETSTSSAQEHLVELGFDCKVHVEPLSIFRLSAKYVKRGSPVSVVVPTAFQRQVGGDMYLSMLLRSLAPHLDEALGDEIILVHGEGENPSAILPLLETKLIVSIEDWEKFNFSRRSNIGFLAARNEHILLLNDDVILTNENPLDQLFGILDLPKVGVVGALLAYPDYNIQHGGHTFINGLPGHAHYKSRNFGDKSGGSIVDGEAVGVTGALMFQHKSTWESVGGFSNLFPNNFNDVDYCLKIRSMGLSVIQANSVQGIHFESVSRVNNVQESEKNMLLSRWRDAMLNGALHD